MSSTTEPLTGNGLELRITDLSTIPDAAPAELFYQHKPSILQSTRELWSKRDIVMTLAERDLRASYKEAALGILWAVLVPLAFLGILLIIFSKVKIFKVDHIPYALYAYPGLIAWQYFTNCMGRGSTSVLGNKSLLNKVQFPRECFPISVCVGAIINTMAALIPLGILMVVEGRAPRIETLYVPLFMLIEMVFTMGVVVGVAALIIHVRDLVQLVPVITQFGMFLTPVIWPFTGGKARIPGLGSFIGLAIYSALNPLGPVIDNIRRTMLLGLQPQWSLLAIATASAFCYLIGGYRLFKRLEVDFADIA